MSSLQISDLLNFGQTFFNSCNFLLPRVKIFSKIRPCHFFHFNCPTTWSQIHKKIICGQWDIKTGADWPTHDCIEFALFCYFIVFLKFNLIYFKIASKDVIRCTIIEHSPNGKRTDRPIKKGDYHGDRGPKFREQQKCTYPIIPPWSACGFSIFKTKF